MKIFLAQPERTGKYYLKKRTGKYYWTSTTKLDKTYKKFPGHEHLNTGLSSIRVCQILFVTVGKQCIFRKSNLPRYYKINIYSSIILKSFPNKVLFLLGSYFFGCFFSRINLFTIFFHPANFIPFQNWI